MTTIFIKHTVEDYDSWKAGFDAHASTREEYGSPEEYRLFREAGNPNEVVMVGEWESAEAFHRFMEASDVREKMNELGVTSGRKCTSSRRPRRSSPSNHLERTGNESIRYGSRRRPRRIRPVLRGTGRDGERRCQCHGGRLVTRGRRDDW